MRAEFGKTYYTWNDIHNACDAIIESLGEWKPKTIVPVVRGGLIPGTIIAHKLGIKDVCPVTIQTRDGDIDEGEVVPDMMWEVMCKLTDSPILMVEDIVDTGKTMEIMLSVNPQDNVKFSAVTVNDDCDVAKIKHIHSGYRINKDNDPSWIVFPWEV